MEKPNQNLKLPDLSEYIHQMAKCNDTKQWIDHSKNLLKSINDCTRLIQDNGLAELFPTPSDYFSNLDLSDNKSSWFEIRELFYPYHDIDKNISCQLWLDNAAKFIGSFKSSALNQAFCIHSDGKLISLLVKENETNESNLFAFFPGNTNSKRKIAPFQHNCCWFGGIPTSVTTESIHHGIDTFISSMYGDAFSFFINFKLITQNKITDIIKQLEIYLDTFKILNNLNVSTGTGKNFQGSLNMALDRVSGNNLIKLLTIEIERLKIGQLKGFWQCEILLSAEDKNTLEKASSIITSLYGGEDSIPMKFQKRDNRFYTYYTSSEIAAIFPFPSKDVPGITIKPLYSFGTNQSQTQGRSIELGNILFHMQPTKNTFSLNLESLQKHTLVAGITGSGKTTTVKKILSELTRNGIPFLVIEPVKSEYRDIDGVRFIEVGKDDFSVNLFKPSAPETPILTHIDYLRAVFGASFVLYPPMPYILESAIYHAYAKKKFAFDNLDKYCIHYPNIIDLIYSIEDIVKDLKYSDRLRDDVLASLKIRFSNLLHGYKGKIFNANSTQEFSELMEKPTVINLNQVVDDEQKALLMSILLAYLYEYRMAQGAQQELQHVTIIEEAHRLLSKTTENNPDVANPKAKAVEFFANLLAEIRSYGEGLIIAEQIPTKLIPDVIKNTGTKIIHKLVSMDDKLVMGNTMNFEEKQENFFTLLKPGQAIVFTEQTLKPIVINIKKN